MVIQLARLGDLVQTLPLLKALRRSGETEITLVLDKRVASAAEAGIDCDRIIAIDLNRFGNTFDRNNIIDTYNRFWSVLKPLNGQSYRTVFNLNRSNINAALVSQVEAEAVVGFIPSREAAGGFRYSPPMRVLFNQGHNRKFARIHIADLFRRLSGASSAVNPPEWKISPQGREYGEKVISKLAQGGYEKFIALHLGAGAHIRRWGGINFAALLKALNRNRKYGFVLVGNERDEAETLFKLSRNQTNILDLSGKTTIDQLAGVFSAVDLMVGADSGPLQLAAVSGTKVLGLYFASASLYETGPLGEGHYVLQAAPDCAPCSEDKPECGGNLCRGFITPEDAAAIIDRILSGENDFRKDIQLDSQVALFRSVFDQYGQYYEKIAAVLNGNFESNFYRELWSRLLARKQRDFDPGSFYFESIEFEVRKIGRIPQLLPLAQQFYLTTEDEGPISAAAEFLAALEILRETGILIPPLLPQKAVLVQ